VSRYRFNISGTAGGIAQGLTQFAYRPIEPVFEINKRVGCPQLVAQLLSGDQRARSPQQHGKELKWLILEFYLLSRLAQLSGGKIELVCTELNRLSGQVQRIHLQLSLDLCLPVQTFRSW
jgi:hypothetical protein